jgi:SAM-dependent methyltransferase
MPRQLAERLARGLHVDDDELDALFPVWARALSRLHWTPIEVARRAARWLVTSPGSRILDIGAGVGKFALVGALVTDGQFVGVEQRPAMVAVATAAGRGLGARRARFVTGDMASLDWQAFTGFYLYNPFLEDLREEGPLERTGDDRSDAFTACVRLVQDRLARAPVGTRVATFHGFGGELPPGYREEPQPAPAIKHLALWRKDGIRCTSPAG